MLGEFSFDAMSQEGWKGEFFLALYLLICMVLMVNLLIAYSLPLTLVWLVKE